MRNSRFTKVKSLLEENKHLEEVIKKTKSLDYLVMTAADIIFLMN